MQKGDGGRVAERGGVEGAEVTLGVEDERPESGLVEGRDVGDVRDDAAEGDGDPRAGDVDLRRAVGQSGDRAIKREHTRGAAVSGVEERDAGEADGVADGEITLADEQAGADGHADRAGAERSTEDTIATLHGGAARADDDAARADGEAAGELVLSGELEQAVAGLGDRDARARDDRGDVEGREDVRDRRRDAGDLDGVDVEDLGPGGQDDASVGDFGDDVRIVRGGREGGGAAQRQERIDPDVEVGELVAAELTAAIVERDRGEFVDGVLREGETTAAVDGDGVGGRDGPRGVDVDGRHVLAAPTAVEDDAAGGDDHGGRARRVDVQVARIDDGAAGVGVGAREDLDAGAGLDVGERRAHGDVLEHGVEDDVRSAESVGAGGGRARGRDAHDDGVGGGVDGLDESASDDVRAGHGHAGVDAGRAGDGVERDGRRTEDDGVGGGTREVLRGGVVAVDDQFRQRGGQDAADGGGADGDRTVVRAAEDAAEAEGEDVRRRGESQLVMRVARETQDVGRGRPGGEGRDGVGAEGGVDVGLGDELGELARAEVGVVAGETAVPDDAHAGDRIVSRVVFVIGDGPGADETARRRDEGRVEDDAGGQLRLTETTGADEVDRGAGRAGEARSQEVGAPEGGTGSRDTDVAVALEQAERAEAFRIVGIDQTVEEQRAAVERDRGCVVDAVQQLDVGVVAVVDLESSVGEVDRGGIAKLSLVAKVETPPTDVGRSAISLERADRQGARTGHGGEVDVGTLDGTVEA